MRVEEIANARNKFEEQINDLRKQIDQITNQRGTLIDQKFTDLQTQQKEWELNQAKLKLEQLKADRDWQATLRTLHNEDVKLGITKKQFGLSEAGVTGKYRGKPTLESIKTAVAARQAAKRLGISVAQYNERVRHNLVTEANAARKLQVSQQKNAMSILDAALGIKKGNVTISQRRELDPTQGAAMAYKNPNIIVVPQGKGKAPKYYIDEKHTLNQDQFARQYGSGYGKNPQALYDLLIGNNIPAPVALKVTRAKTLIHDFKPGKQVKYTSSDLAAIGHRSFQELRGIALQRGWKPPRKKNATTQSLIDYILMTQQGMP
jgi:hypothetical protein